MKTNSTKIELLVLILIGALLIGASTLFAGDARLIKEKTLQVQANQVLRVDASGADVFVNTWDKNEALVKIYGNKKAEDKMRFEIEETDYGLKITAKRKGSSWFNFWNWGGYDLKIEVTLPQNFNSEIETSGGDIRLSNIKGKNELLTSGGDVNLSNSIGDLFVETSGGDIKLNTHNGGAKLSTSGGNITTIKSKGDLKASTSGGDIHLDVTDGRVMAKTSGGDIDLIYTGINRGIEASTSGGDIKVRVQNSLKANVWFETTGGDIESNFSNTRTNKITRSSLKADYNGGGEKFELKTSGGDITVNEL